MAVGLCIPLSRHTPIRGRNCRRIFRKLSTGTRSGRSSSWSGCINAGAFHAARLNEIVLCGVSLLGGKLPSRSLTIPVWGARMSTSYKTRIVKCGPYYFVEYKWTGGFWKGFFTGEPLIWTKYSKTPSASLDLARKVRAEAIGSYELSTLEVVE